jgi:hypothetical protein
LLIFVGWELIGTEERAKTGVTVKSGGRTPEVGLPHVDRLVDCDICKLSASAMADPLIVTGVGKLTVTELEPGGERMYMLFWTPPIELTIKQPMLGSE